MVAFIPLLVGRLSGPLLHHPAIFYDHVSFSFGLQATLAAAWQVRDRRVGLKVHHNCFVGQEAVTVIAIEFGLSRYEVNCLDR